MDINTLSELKSYVGQEIGCTDWLTVTQEMVNEFARASHDHQWIHVDVEKARKDSPFGGPIAHGFLTLSLFSYFMGQIIKVKSSKMGVNYGLNKVRFTAAVPVGARLRGRATLLSAEPYGDNGMKFINQVVVEMEGSDKPACIGEFISLSFE